MTCLQSRQTQSRTPRQGTMHSDHQLHQEGSLLVMLGRHQARRNLFLSQNQARMSLRELVARENLGLLTGTLACQCNNREGSLSSNCSREETLTTPTRCGTSPSMPSPRSLTPRSTSFVRPNSPPSLRQKCKRNMLATRERDRKLNFNKVFLCSGVSLLSRATKKRREPAGLPHLRLW